MAGRAERFPSGPQPIVVSWGLGGEADANLSAACWSCLKRAWETGHLDDLEKTLTMSVPDFQSLMLPALKTLAGGAQMPLSTMRESVAAGEGFITRGCAATASQWPSAGVHEPDQLGDIVP